ncbi:HCO3- transporter family protein [Nitzschia inconspicua]|uniref:HCO3- transporter family protein n=1 Tax=Nitzschia inconspicua TaxID=303405 RepID=A0A9K3K5J0_9STRA|nr:HCO3- transporter family protein [Nitzschia inconspicua]KAG7343675.1 HCO3- transporter family protein [Nitzschia inconspicua]
MRFPPREGYNDSKWKRKSKYLSAERLPQVSKPLPQPLYIPKRSHLLLQLPVRRNTKNDDDKNNENNDDHPLIQFLTGMKDDFKAWMPLYKDDWMGVKSPLKVFNACIFTFVIQLIPALIFAELMDRQNRRKFGNGREYFEHCHLGIVYAIFAGQSLVIMGITGPVSLLLGTSYRLAAQFDAEYFPFFFWTCVWAGMIHILTALRDLIHPTNLGDNDTNGDEIPDTRILTSYNTLIAVVLATAFSYIPGFDQNGALERVNVKAPWDWHPTANRTWVINPFEGIDVAGIFAALVPGFMFKCGP